MAARFSADRLTPGKLGLELTTLLALLAVGSFSFFLLGDIVEQAGEPRIDRWAEDVSARLNMDALVSVAKVVTQLGSLAAAAEFAVLTAGWALVRRRLDRGGGAGRRPRALLRGLHVTKDAFDRLRPSNPLIATDLGRSRPAIHARGHARRLRHGPGARRHRLGLRVAAVTVAVTS